MDARDALEVREGPVDSFPRPPLVRGLPLLGSALDFLDDPVRFLLARYRDHGPVFRMRLGPTTYTVIAGVEGSVFVTRTGRHLVTSEGIFEETARIMNGSPRSNLTNLDGERHTELRGLFRVGMSRSAGQNAMGRVT